MLIIMNLYIVAYGDHNYMQLFFVQFSYLDLLEIFGMCILQNIFPLGSKANDWKRILQYVTSFAIRGIKVNWENSGLTHFNTCLYMLKHFSSTFTHLFDALKHKP